MSTMNRVRQAIEPSHQAIEQTEFSKSLMDGRITRSAYCQYLTQMWHIHSQLEHTLPGCATVGHYFEPSMIRTPALERDLVALDSAVASQETMKCTQKIEQQLQGWSRSAPFALLGCCYILEGSRMGSLMIGRALIKALRLEASPVDGCPAGVEYHLLDAAQTPRRVKNLKAAIDAASLTDAQEQELTLGTCAFMSMLNELYHQLPVQSPLAAATVMHCPMHALTQQAKLKSA